MNGRDFVKDNKRTPLRGLNILENLHKKFPNHQRVRSNLVNSYIHLGEHDLAKSLIKTFYSKKQDVESLKFQAWLANKNQDFLTEQILWDKVIDKTYYGEYHGILGDLIYRSDKEIIISDTDIPLFSVQRNEILRLPYFLEYYRKLGVTKFFFTDNNSDDGSFEFLLEQPDCYVFWTNNSHNQAGSGMVWNQHLIKKYVLENQWYLVIDADELLIYPHCETLLLPNLIRYLDNYHYNAIASYILDMFPKNQQEQLNIQSGDNLIEKSPYFYNHYIFNHQIESPYHKVKGGIFPVFGHLKHLNVTPLFKKRNPNVKLLASRHLTTPTKIANISSCLLHFKFIGDFYQKSFNEVQRKEHWAGGIEYKRYAQFYDTIIDENFDFTDLEKTTKYQNSKQLIDLGLIKTSDEWDIIFNWYLRAQNKLHQKLD